MDRDRFVLVASGPSLTQEQVDYVRGKAVVIVINDNYRLAPWADHHYACDSQWWKWHEDDPTLLNFQGQKWSQTESWTAEDMEHFTKKHRIRFVKSQSGQGLSTEEGLIYQGSNSGYQAINLAYHLGAKKIVLLGYDMQMTNGKSHWFGDHPNNVKSSYTNWMPFYENLAKSLPGYGLDIINCTKETALTCFPRQSLEEVI